MLLTLHIKSLYREVFTNPLAVCCLLTHRNVTSQAHNGSADVAPPHPRCAVPTFFRHSPPGPLGQLTENQVFPLQRLSNSMRFIHIFLEWWYPSFLCAPLQERSGGAVPRADQHLVLSVEPGRFSRRDSAAGKRIGFRFLRIRAKRFIHCGGRTVQQVPWRCF